jgi:hypothetical protein
MHVLQALLAPMPVREFLQRYFTRAPFALPDHAARYTRVFTDADFAAMVEGPRSILRVVRDGRLVLDQARLSWGEAQGYYRRGHTVLVRHAEWSSTGVMRVVRLQLLEFLQHRLAHDPFWCQRLAWVPQAEAGGPAPTEQPPYLWEDMRA